jgi:transcriptional antiterminator Rof (Rho-off)
MSSDIDIDKLYNPVSCDFYDKLEVFAKIGKPVRIWYFEEKGKKKKLDSVIKAVIIHDYFEWIVLEDGREIALDKLLEVGGVIVRYEM